MRKHPSLYVAVVFGLAIVATSACRDDAATDSQTMTAGSTGTAEVTTGTPEQTNGSSGASAETTETVADVAAPSTAGADSDTASREETRVEQLAPVDTESAEPEDGAVTEKGTPRPKSKGRGGAGDRARGSDGQVGLFALEPEAEPSKPKRVARRRPKPQVTSPGKSDRPDGAAPIQMPNRVSHDTEKRASDSLAIVDKALSKSMNSQRFAGKDFEQQATIESMMNQMKAFRGGKGFEELRQQAEAAARPPQPEIDLDGFENRTVAGERVVAKPMVETATDPMSTFAVDVDTGAYTLARARLREGYLPKRDEVRAEEFLNYFHYDYPAPTDGAFGVSLEASTDPFDSSRHLLRVGVQGRPVSDDERPPAHLTFLVDVSGSMFGPDKLGLAREALELVTRNLRPDDTVAIVTYARGANVQMWPAGASESDIVLANIAAIEPGGSSALDAGLRLAYDVASTHYNAAHINRVVVMGDGRANVGETRPDAVLRTVRAGVEDGVMLSTIGFGARAFNDKMMEQLADNGDGNYFFVDSYLEAQRVFGDRLCGTIHTIAKDVKIQVEFDPNSVLKHRLIGYDNRRLQHKEFRDDAVDAGEIGAGHSVTALYELVLADAPAEKIATVRVRHKPPAGNVAIETEFVFRSEEVVPDVRQASADFKFAAAVALFAQALGRETGADGARINLIGEIAREGVVDATNQPDRAEFLELVAEAQPYFEQ